MPARVLFLNRSYWPDVEASGQLLTELCEDLSEEFDVHVLAGQPNQNPDGTAFRRHGTERHHGVTIHRVWHTRFSKASLLGRAVNLFTFLISAAVAAFLVPRPDIVVTETDPFLLTVLGHWLQSIRGSRHVAYIQDLYPDVALALGKIRDGAITRCLAWQLTKALRTADLVVVLNDSVKHRVASRGVPEERLVVQPNWADTAQIRPLRNGNPVPQDASAKPFVVMYAGNHGLCHQLDQILDTAVLLRDRTDIHFAFVGDGVSKPGLVADAASEKLANVSFRPYVPKSELAENLSAADAHLLTLDPRVEHCIAPCKLYGILASGVPTIAVVNEHSVIGTLVRERRVGLVVPPEAPERLAEAVQYLAANRDQAREMGHRGRELAVAEFDRHQATARIADLLHGLVPATEPAHVPAT